MKNVNVLHLTSHLGGGVGTVILNWLKTESLLKTNYEHTVACLEVNKNSMQGNLDAGFKIYEGMYNRKELLLEFLKNADIVLIHWWNHPVLYDVMINWQFPSCRLICWSHVSALHAPYVYSKKLIDYSDCFVFTSPISYEAREILNLPENLKEKLDVVWSACGTEIFKDFKKQAHNGSIVGITGTVDYVKLHPEYIKMCADIKIPDVKFIVCSGDQDQVMADAERYHIADRMTFTGRVPNVLPYLAICDVFGYPLQPKHFGTCEQAIGEAMIAEVVPVVLDNPAEKHIVEDGVTGIVAKNPAEYSSAIEFLFKNPDRRFQMAKNASRFAREKYSVSKKVAAWDKIFCKIIKTPKSIKSWHSKSINSGAEVFIEAIGDYGKVFREYIDADKNKNFQSRKNAEEKICELFKSNIQWHSNNKGGVKQYLRLFPNDNYLNAWEKLLV